MPRFASGLGFVTANFNVGIRRNKHLKLTWFLFAGLGRSG
jgi:hypothetical protein